jgi:hypothetical protein
VAASCVAFRATHDWAKKDSIFQLCHKTTSKINVGSHRSKSNAEGGFSRLSA